MNNAIILSAGKGSRMKSELPKGAFRVLYRPMVVYSVVALREAGFDKINVVVGHKKEIIEDILQGFNCVFSEQKVLNGTAKAVESAKENLENEDGNTVILPVDMPLITKNLLQELSLFHEQSGNDLTVLSSIVDNPYSYGRIVRDKYGNFTAIKEELEASEEEKKIKEVNSGVYMVNNKLLFKALAKVKNDNKKGEYYLTDIVSILKKEKYKVGSFVYKEADEITGVNDLKTLAHAETILRRRINEDLMDQGIYIVNPDTVTIGPDVIIEHDVTILPNTYIYGLSKIGQGSLIGPNSELINAVIHKNASVAHSIVRDSEVMDNAIVGPFAHIRNHTVVGENSLVGNYVEVKNTVIDENTKAAHLAYIGDATIGKNVNFGCGCVTVNYDGKKKWKTKIGDDAFIGASSNLIAPIEIERGAIIAAGSTISKNVPEGAMAIARPTQLNKENYASLIKEKAETRDKNKEY